MTAKGKIQRIKADDINIIGRNTQGVRIMNVDEGDSLIAVVRVPPEENTDVLETIAVIPGDVATLESSVDEVETEDGEAAE
jgi:DNA gyrase subunit A